MSRRAPGPCRRTSTLGSIACRSTLPCHAPTTPHPSLQPSPSRGERVAAEAPAGKRVRGLCSPREDAAHTATWSLRSSLHQKVQKRQRTRRMVRGGLSCQPVPPVMPALTSQSCPPVPLVMPLAPPLSFPPVVSGNPVSFSSVPSFVWPCMEKAMDSRFKMSGMTAGD